VVQQRAHRATADVLFKCDLPEEVGLAKQQGIWPYFVALRSQDGPEGAIEGRRFVMLGSNNYLGLTQHAAVRAAALEAIERFGTSSTGSRFLNGTLELHEAIETRLARFVGKPASLIFTTGYQTNIGVISALLGRHDTAVIDHAVHASVVDGCRLSSAEVVRFPHNDVVGLERNLARAIERGRPALVAVDGVFSMEGDLADLAAIVALKRRYGFRLMVDDAHGIGVLGEHGRGTAEHFGVEDDVDLLVGTFSKAFASTGGFVAGERRVIEYIKLYARSFTFSASIPPSQLAAAAAALDIIEREPERRARLHANATYLREGVKRIGLDTGRSQSPIIPIILGDRWKVVRMWKALFDRGVFVNAAVRWAAEPGRDLIRMSVMATHTREHLDTGLNAIEDAARELDLVPSTATPVG
jgi:8-amino-7-oxononanoate synthase